MTEGGTCTFALLPASWMVAPLIGTAPVRDKVPVRLLPPLIEFALRARPVIRSAFAGRT